MFQEENWVVAAQGRAQQPNRVGGVRRESRPPADRVREDRFARDAMPWIAAALAEAQRNTHDHRRGKIVVGTPADGATVGNLLHCRVGILAELNPRYRPQPPYRHPHTPANDTPSTP